MSFLNKMLARVGIGAAQIDTVLEQEAYYPNAEIKGMVYIQGGNVDQEIGHIYIEVMTHYIREHNDQKTTVNYRISKHSISEYIQIQNGQKIEIPFSFILPPQTPLTLGHQKVWLHTGLDIEMSIDPTDQDYIVVNPHPYMAKVLEATERLGFQFKASTVEYASRAPFGVPYIQEIEFYPGSNFHGQITELELIMTFQEDGLQVIVELDRRGHGLSGFFNSALDLNEVKSSLDLSVDELNGDITHLTDRLYQLIQQQVR